MHQITNQVFGDVPFVTRPQLRNQSANFQTYFTAMIVKSLAFIVCSLFGPRRNSKKKKKKVSILDTPMIELR